MMLLRDAQYREQAKAVKYSNLQWTSSAQRPTSAYDGPVWEAKRGEATLLVWEIGRHGSPFEAVHGWMWALTFAGQEHRAGSADTREAAMQGAEEALGQLGYREHGRARRYDLPHAKQIAEEALAMARAEGEAEIERYLMRFLASGNAEDLANAAGVASDRAEGELAGLIEEALFAHPGFGQFRERRGSVLAADARYREAARYVDSDALMAAMDVAGEQAAPVPLNRLMSLLAARGVGYEAAQAALRELRQMGQLVTDDDGRTYRIQYRERYAEHTESYKH